MYEKFNHDYILREPINIPPLGFFFLIANSRSGHNFVKQNINSWMGQVPKSTVNKKFRRYTNFENFSPQSFDEAIINIDMNEYPHSISFILTRDLLNWYASVIHFTHRPRLTDDGTKILRPTNIKHLRAYINSWTAITKEFYDETNYLPPDFIRVNYDEFFKSQEYRKNICNQIYGAEYNEDYLNITSPAGRGSSFDGVKYKNNASEMKVLERYKQMEKKYHHLWNVLVEFPETIELYLNNFNITDDQKEFVENLKRKQFRHVHKS